MTQRDQRMDTSTALQAFQTLPMTDRVELLCQLWDQLLDDGWQPRLDDGLKAELDRRWANYIARGPE
jgi:putative addiction module component (TIGR02574 family)